MTKSLQKHINSLPTTPGIYKFLDKKGIVLYVGKAKNLSSRVKSYFNKTQDMSPAKQDMMEKISKIETMPANTEEEALILESMQIKKHKPAYNITFKDDKDYNFVKIDYTHKYPIITTIRRPKIDKKPRSKIKYCGPFTSGYALQENLRLLRRIFPYRRKVKPLTKFEKDLLAKRSIGPVPETHEEYLDMIKRLAKAINGKTAPVKRELKLKMEKLSNQNKYEIAAKVRDQIKWLDIFNTRQKIVTAAEYLSQDIPIYDKTQTALNNLKTKLKLKTIPHRIEGYDISNIQGEFSVGSMVVFTDGKADKSEYRKFKIKTIKGADDFAMLAEIVKRRFNNKWDKPDLILLDGGKGQLSAVLNVILNKAKQSEESREIGIERSQRDPSPAAQDDGLNMDQFIAIAKKQEQIFQGSKLRKINLDKKSDASHLLQQIRDEAHRFAQKYYHFLHSKSYAKQNIRPRRTNKSRKTRTKKAQ